jgi:DNA uptake protein ComE-like DNA-binding protein
MRTALRAFLQYSLVERTGFVLIGSLLLILLTIRCCLSWWIAPPAPDPALAAQLQAEYDAWRVLQDDAETHLTAVTSSPAQAESFAFDPNTLDSAGFIRLGMPPKAIKGLLNWRRKGKRFRKAEDLEPLYNLPKACYARLAPLIHIENAALLDAGPPQRYPAREMPPSSIEINTADSATLDRWVPGIGTVLAKKIIARRQALGGYRSLDQLMEVYHFPDSAMEKLQQHLTVDPARCQLMDLNTVTLERLTAHPYIGGKIGLNIILFREALGGYSDLTQLRQVPLMTAENYRKIAPCFTTPPPRK